jgi:hypothetical protein
MRSPGLISPQEVWAPRTMLRLKSTMKGNVLLKFVPNSKVGNAIPSQNSFMFSCYLRFRSSRINPSLPLLAIRFRMLPISTNHISRYVATYSAHCIPLVMSSRA